MSDIALLFVVTALILLSGVFLTVSWHKFIVRHRKEKNSKHSH